MTEPGACEQATKGYFAVRWRGLIPPGTLFWWDMVVIGTLVNAVAGLVSLILLARGVHNGMWGAFYVLLIPYNLFLLLSVWRTARDSTTIRSLATCWFACTLIL